jgi:hypothetical protein
MGRFVRWLSFAAAAATVVAVLVPVSPAVAKTTVKSKGGVVTIVVKVDVYGGEGQTGPNGQPLDQYWEEIVNNQWGQAFNQLPYKNCYKFELKLDIRLRSRDADDRDGWHRIHVTAPRTGNDWTGVGWGKVPETSRNPRTGDGTRSFENDQAGTIPVNAPPTVVAHEFGHVFGLGDDRQGGEAKPGRDGTLMVGGAEGVDPNQPLRIDQDLIDRIGKLIEKHLQNQGKELPDCESWTGTFSSSSPPACSRIYEGPVELVVEPDGSVTGSGTANWNPVCSVPTEAPGAQFPLQFSGKRDRSGFHLTVSGAGGEASLDLRVTGKTAEGTAPGPVTSTYNLTCAEGCDEKKKVG